ncbi:iron ABC transporter permease [Diaphorobacter sp. HDW4A]|uniref:FecCD family ABC transporter permease n=1 Tax=Diaphorobacter sp. HDW4A TaxID=2714924 RepID=UPI00140BBF97|nr:iron ABC transporter permease [Diaphorobacter sp. HDW4A]QIL83423.1 iron ABC transporter permease [Diaphorobacter sp. HDW4A]
MKALRARSLGAWLGVLALLLLCSMTAGVALGSVNVPPLVVWRVVLGELFGSSSSPADISVQQHQIVWLVRAPRVLMAALVGAGLATVGVVMQAMVRNPLADPYMLGVSSGASVGAVSVLAWGSFAFAGVYAISAGAFVGALIATMAVYWLARGRARVQQSTRLILSGVAVGYFFTGLTSLITLTSGQRDLAGALMTWTLGSLAGTQWSHLSLPALVLLAGMVWLALQTQALNALMMGDETAATLGVNTHALRRTLFVVVSLLTGVMVAASGAIGFVGLVVPHVARMLVGSDHRRVLPVAAVMGALFLVVVDLLARVLFSPMDVPVGVITALIGGPFFVWLLMRQTPARKELQ